MLARRTAAAAPPRAAADGLGRRAARPGDDRRLPRGDRPRAGRRLRPDRDRPRHRQPRRRAGAPGLDGQAAAGDRDADRRRARLQLRAASSPTFFSRYLDGERFEGEWWPTGDLVREDEDGYLFFEGRDDDIILSSGYRIGPTEVEAALLSHPAVAEAAAVAAPDPERGSVVRAIVVPRDREPSEELARELQEHCKRETAPYKFPRIVEFVAELPKTSSGKIKRAQLRAGVVWAVVTAGSETADAADCRPRLLRRRRQARRRGDGRLLGARRARRDPRRRRA